MFRVGDGSASTDDALLACAHGFAHDVYEWARRHPRAQAAPLWAGLRRWVAGGRLVAPGPREGARGSDSGTREVRPLGDLLTGLQRPAGR